MASVKKFTTSYTLDGPTVTVTGNLNILGTQTAIETTNTTLKDNKIVLNDGETGNGVSTLGTTAGLVIDRGAATVGGNVELRWNEAYLKWEITNDGTNYANISASAGSGGNLSLKDDVNPYLNANLNTHGYFITSNIGNINFAGNIQLNNQAVTPTAVTGATVVYAASPNAGTSGVYVVNGSAANEELVTKRRAFGFSLLL
jgi:hypothetical protein